MFGGVTVLSTVWCSIWKYVWWGDSVKYCGVQRLENMGNFLLYLAGTLGKYKVQSLVEVTAAFCG
jgi:hypothetical protein